MKQKREITKRLTSHLSKMIIILRNEGMLRGDTDDDYRVYLGQLGVIISTMGLAISLGEEEVLVDVMSEISDDLIRKIDEVGEDIDMEYILRMMGGKNPDLN